MKNLEQATSNIKQAIERGPGGLQRDATLAAIVALSAEFLEQHKEAGNSPRAAMNILRDWITIIEDNS